jgi:hypothetical protein
MAFYDVWSLSLNFGVYHIKQICLRGNLHPNSEDDRPTWNDGFTFVWLALRYRRHLGAQLVADLIVQATFNAGLEVDFTI